MTLLSNFLGLYACLFYKEHEVPHVHIYFGRPSRRKAHLLVVRIADNRVLAVGQEFPRNRMYPAQHWIFLHRQELLKAWTDCRDGIAPTKINPLAVGEFSPVLQEPRKSRYDWYPTIRRLDKLGNGRMRAHLDDGRVYIRVKYAHADTARPVLNGNAVKRNRADTNYESTRAFTTGPHVRRVR